MTNSTATCSTRRGWAPSGCTLLLSHQERNRQPYHTGSVAGRVNKDRACHRTPGRRCQVCYWCIIEDSWKRQHYHWHIVHKDIKSCGETPGTNTWSRQVQMEHPWTLWNEMDKFSLNNSSWKSNSWGTQCFFSGKEDKHEHGVGFLVHKDILNTVMGCRPDSSRLITIRSRAVLFIMTVVQAYSPTSDYDYNEIERFYNQPLNVIDGTSRKL